MLPYTIRRVRQEDLTLERVLKQGAQGIIYTGTLVSDWTCTPVVIKQLHFSNRHQLEQEAKVLQSLNGAGGAPVLFGVTHEEPFYLVMSHCPGHELQMFSGSCTHLEGLQVFIKLCEAVEEIHKKGFAHNDLHSENILVDRTSSNFIIHIIDMGYAEPLTGDLFDGRTWRDYEKLVSHAKEIARTLDSSTKFAEFKSIVETASNTVESVKLLVETAKVCCVQGIDTPPSVFDALGHSKHMYQTYFY
nr:casein kinase I-like [Procambarus clarkii]